MKYVIYLRVSTDEQDLRTQLEKILSFIKSRDKSEIQYEVFSDKITSKKSLKNRAGMQAALKCISKNDILMGMRLDRLARNVYETTQIIDHLDNAGADIVMVDQPSLKNKVMLGMYAGMAEEEGKLIRKRIKEKMEVKKTRNERVSGHIPYGYQIHPTELVETKGINGKVEKKLGKLIECDTEQHTIKRMVELFEMGYSYRRICDKLAEENLLARNCKPWAKMSVYQILLRLGLDRKGFQLPDDSRMELYH